MAPTSMAPIPASPPARPTEALEQRVSDTGLAPVWTDEDEEELADIKAKLHQAHKSWSEEQELWHERVSNPDPIPLADRGKSTFLTINRNIA